MAAEFPVVDVLCNALEMISTLGSNLRTRSERLKGGKIRKDKLRNSHAIQRAANKLQYLCHLTKKSLNIVENRVKNVIDAVSADQSQSSTALVPNSKLQSFEYKNYKLRISKSVNVKHFLSAKVSATRMSLTILDKYPVYYDCKLYRTRKLKSDEECLTQETIERSIDSEKDNNILQQDIAEKQDTDLGLAVCTANKDNSENCTNIETIHNAIENQEKKTNSGKSDGLIIENLENCALNKDASDVDNAKTCHKENINQEITLVNKEMNVISKLSTETSKLEINEKDKDKDTDAVTRRVFKDNESKCHKKTSISVLKSSKKYKRVSFMNGSSSDEDTEQNSVKDPVKSDQKSITVSNEDDDVVCISPADPTNDVTNENSRSSIESNKPVIKCVNINKLLKPDVIEKLATNYVHKTYKNKRMPKRCIKNGSISSEDEFWIQKRKEVKAFKAKNLQIHITRLPKIEMHFLKEHNLKRITKLGELLLELPSNVDVHKNVDMLSKSSSEEVVSKNVEVIEEAKRIKNVLLESDSDNDKDQNHKRLKAKRKRKATDSETHGNVDEPEFHGFNTNKNNDTNKFATPTENIDDTVVSAEKSTKTNNERICVTPERIENNDEIKTALLNDSSEDLTPKKKRRKIDDASSQSNKSETDSLQAKKVLMTYSSSDSENEVLDTALKNIKNQLLKGGSSDEESGNVIMEKASSEKNEDLGENNIIENMEQVENGSKDQNSDSKESEKDTDSSSSRTKSTNSKKKIARYRVKSRRKRYNKSNTEDEGHINGLTNLRNLTRRRRRRASTSSSEASQVVLKRSPRIRNKMDKKVLVVNEEGFLQAHSDSSSESEGGSGAENNIEDLPVIKVSDLNGDGFGHLAKDDLLGESDSSDSNDKTDEKETEDSKKPTSDTEDSTTLKSKRRKANAISSDSEAGSSRKKDKTVKLSDFEDSEDESSESAKAKKRKKKTENIDGSDSGSNDGSMKKRRRIKQLDDSDISGSDDDDGETEGRNKHGRKNIRKVMGKNQLEEATKKAAREEKERIARIAERQKIYNNLDFDESGKPDEVVLEKVVLDFDPETKEPLIQVDRGLVKKLKPHQANGIKFMWDACFESVKRIKKDRGSGCILAHCMGLGKTLQVISLTHTLLSHSDLTGVNRVLVVCPLSTVLNWVNEIKMWLKHTQDDCEVDVYELSRFKQNSERAFQLQQWFDHGGVCVLGYEMFRNLSADNSKKFKKKMLKSFQQSLVDPGPDLVVCDEGHLLKNEKTSLSQSMNRVKTRRRIVLTGTPLQNNLKEYYCMVQFVKPNLLGKYNEYLNRFVNPITNGQYTDSTEHDIKIMKRRSHVLHKMLDGAVQRRDYGVLAPFLPPKHEYVLFITLSEVQVKLYQHYLDNFSRRPLPGKSSGFLFPDFQSLQRIWTHPLVLKYNSERYEIMQQKKREREEEEDSEGSLVDFIDDDSTPDESTTEESSDDMSDASDDSRKKSKKKKSVKKSKTKESKVSGRRNTRANPVEMVEAEIDEVVEVKNENPTEWWIKLVTDDVLDDMRNSHKLVLLFDILRQCEAIGDKLLVFSQSLYSLDLIEHFLGKVDEATQEGRIDEKLGGHVGSWSPGVDYFRLDGSTSCENRSIWCKNFNREDNPRARLFLISTRAGGLGINLVAANRVVIFDVSWNPSHDVQSIFRVYRFGQKKPCYVYRFLAMGTMEEKIYERQVTKQAISKRVIDEQQIDRHYAENDLAELYKFEPEPPEPRPIPPLPKDRLFAEMLREHEKEIYKYHEHDSLLENKEEETLSEEERKAAWEDFENEKNRPPPAPFPSPWPLHNGMAPGLFIQQQQQLAYAAIAAMLRKDMPNISDNQIRDMLPLIYNSNPALMQKMSEIYKYAASAQPGLMNPAAMLNSVMNSGAAAAGAGVGGAGAGGGSGLQYEPPWQRQQHHMLQQMLQQQQQQQMGAKYYAGGLGSRDPVAMALQQQRARQLLEPRAAPRPRGRPPARPSTDIVNLDSD